MLQDQFEVAAVCDISPSAAADAARRFHVPRHLTDYRELLAADLDAVLLCHTDPKTEAAVAVWRRKAPVHRKAAVLLAAGDRRHDRRPACRRYGRPGRLHEVYDPAFELAQRAVREMDGIRFVQVNHLHPDNRLHLRQFELRRFDDYPAAAIEQTAAARGVAVRQAIGDATRRCSAPSACSPAA